VTSAPRSPARAIANYIEAKDANRPALMGEAFVADATLEMVVRTGAISFPPRTEGLVAITQVLVTGFGETYERVRTFCLAEPPAADALAYTCDWLVGMSERRTGAVRVGCGTYDWSFEKAAPHRVQGLRITIETMLTLPAATLDAVLTGWLSTLPYPWCPPRSAVASAPRLAGLEPVLRRLSPTGSRPGTHPAPR
jgi:hypothetical protein